MNRLKTVNSISTMAFSIILLLGVSYVGLFYQQKKEKIFIQPSDLIPMGHLKLIQKIEYSGRSGKMVIEKENNTWTIKSPKSLQANPTKIDELLQYLGNLSIKKMHRNDPINLQNFSLTPPLANLKLSSPAKEFEISIGITNAIDQSSYLMFKNKETIYQANSYQLPLDKLDWKDFVDVRLLMHQKQFIQEINIKKGPLQITLLHDGDVWQIKDSNLNSKDAQTLVDFALALKIQTILDSVPEESLNFINKELGQAPTVITILSQGNSAKYLLSRPLNKIAGLEQMEHEVALGKSSLRQEPFILSKETLNSIELLLTREGREQIISKAFEEQ